MKEKGGLTQKAYEHIKEKIIKCELLPEVDISEEDIIREIGISRTPIREALIRLEHEKLVNIFPRKGIFVSSITLNSINEIFQVREVIEPQILRLVCDILPQYWLEDIKKRLMVQPEEQEALSYFVDIDKEFHSYIIEVFKNSYLIQLMNNIFEQNQRLRILTYKKVVDRLNMSNKEHIEIIDALLEKNIDKAESCIRKHIVNARNAALNLNLNHGII